MKFLLSFLISFFFIFSSTNLDLSGVADEFVQIDQKTAVNVTRSVAPDKVVVKKQLHSGNLDQRAFSTAFAAHENQCFSLAEYSYREISNFVSSGAKIYQHIASA